MAKQVDPTDESVQNIAKWYENYEKKHMPWYKKLWYRITKRGL